MARADLPSYVRIGAVLHGSGETARGHARHIAHQPGAPSQRRAIVVAARARGWLDAPDA